MKRIGLIDGDLLVYTVSSAVEQDVNWGNGLMTRHCRLDDGYELILHYTDWYKKRLDLSEVYVCFSSDTNFRKTVYPQYKGNRTAKKPLGYLSFVDYCQDKFPCETMPGIEADDTLGILATQSGMDYHAVIISDDKDLRQIPGDLYVPRTDELITTSVEGGDEYHLRQTLIGDRSDNYPGCPGIGEVKAGAVLASSGDPWRAVVAAFERAGLTEEDALRQARLAKILRYEDYNFEVNAPILWEPKR